MEQITQLNIHDRQFNPQLNSQGKATGWTHLLDPDTECIVPHQTALKLVRNEQEIWSGPIWQANDSSSAATGQQSGSDKCEITAFGWFNELGGSGQNCRLVHTGTEFAAMLAGANGVAWEAENGSYVPLGIDTAIQLAYDVIEYPQTTDAAIIFDLLNRANIDSPTMITPGNIYGHPIGRNLTLQRFQNVGQEITQLVNVESGVDFVIDPVTRKMDLYGPGASSSFMINTGYGQDRGQQTLFSYPGNCVQVSRSRDGTRTQNRVETVGQYGVGRADDLASQNVNRLHEFQQSLSEVVDPNILTAYAQSQVAVLKNPWQIISFTPRPITSEDQTGVPGVPRPFEDFVVGDIIYTRISRGSIQIGTDGNPQPIRVYGFNLSIDDNGVERLTSLQTTYQGIGG
jgi:hypothetical protein